MAIIRTALTMAVKPGSEPAYLDWLRGSIGALEPVYARTGVLSKAVMMAGPQIIAVYEHDRPGAVEAAFAQPESAEMMAGSLGALLDPSVAPRFYESLLVWRNPAGKAARHVALRLAIKPGTEAPYRDWAKNAAARQFDAVWRRFDLALKEVLISGTSVISHYECRDSASVLATFGEPEAIEAMQTNLGPLLDLRPGEPITPFEEVLTWSAGVAARGAARAAG
jgi:hypothetical protein